ncbi:MAG: hypothetical protein AAF184_13415 [Pseudomonadota bacterium]
MAGKKQDNDEILEADFEELSVDDIPGTALPDSLDDDLDAAAMGDGTPPTLKKVGGLRRKKKKKVGARAGGGGGMMRKKKGLAARRAGAGGAGVPGAPGGPSVGGEGRSAAFDESVSSGREVLKQMIQRLTPEEGEADGKRKGMVQALRRVARGYRELEQEVARLEGKLAGKS